jgi:hypothetical protein
MATSKKQIEANRRNAKKSTGPVSAQGKAVSSRNAITHGLHSCDTVINSPYLREDRSQYEHLVKSLVEELRPEGVLQEHLVFKIANCLWRYRRIINAETSQINKQLEPSLIELIRFNWAGSPYRDCEDPSDVFENLPDNADDSSVDSKAHLPDEEDDEGDEDDCDSSRRLANLVGTQSIPHGSFLLHLMHYEMRLDKQLNRAYRLLRHLQLMSAAEKLAEHDREAKRLSKHHNDTERLSDFYRDGERLAEHHRDKENLQNEPISRQSPAPLPFEP